MTNNLKRRYSQHKKQQCKYTKRFHGNVMIAYIERLEHRNKKTLGSMAWKREKQVKNWSPDRKRRQIKIKKEQTAELIQLYMG